MDRSSYAFFDTPLGLCAIIWDARGITGTQLPEDGRGAATRRLQRRFPDAHNGRRRDRCKPADVRSAGRPRKDRHYGRCRCRCSPALRRGR